MEKLKKYLLILGIFITVLGIASTTEEIYGCLLCPLDGTLYFLGVTSEETFPFMYHYCWYTLSAGVLLILISLALFAISKESVRDSVFKDIKFKPLKLNSWRKRRMVFHCIIYTLIIVHITLVILKITDLKSLCPRSLGDLILHGQFGASAIFWLVMFLMVFIWGRGLCGWLCVFAPVQEQSVNLLKMGGVDPGKRKFNKHFLPKIFATILWSSILYNVVKNWSNLSFNGSYGYEVASYWIFIGGVLTTIPLTMFATYYLGSRWFCKYLCPIGGSLGLYSKFGLLKIEVEKSACVNCNVCAKACQMSVNINKYTNGDAINIQDDNCILCGDCIDSCPKKALNFNFLSFLNKARSAWNRAPSTEHEIR